jgi:hypothetical protein
MAGMGCAEALPRAMVNRPSIPRTTIGRVIREATVRNEGGKMVIR